MTTPTNENEVNLVQQIMELSSYIRTLPKHLKRSSFARPYLLRLAGLEKELRDMNKSICLLCGGKYDPPRRRTLIKADDVCADCFKALVRHKDYHPMELMRWAARRVRKYEQKNSAAVLSHYVHVKELRKIASLVENAAARILATASERMVQVNIMANLVLLAADWKVGKVVEPVIQPTTDFRSWQEDAKEAADLAELTWRVEKADESLRLYCKAAGSVIALICTGNKQFYFVAGSSDYFPDVDLRQLCSARDVLVLKGWRAQ